MRIKNYFQLRTPGVLYLFLLIGLTVLCFTGYTKAEAEPAADKETHIILFHVNDMHAQIDNFAKIAWYVEQEKKNNPQTAVFFLNAGDNFSGNPAVDRYEPKGEPILQLMNRMHFDVLNLGNHEFDYGQKALKAFMENANFHIICANVNLRGENQSFPQPLPFTTLKTSTGINIVILGLIEVSPYDHIPATHPANLQGFTFSDPIATAKKYRYLKKQSDIFIALTHLGNDVDEILAKEMKELDLIIGGHTHTRIDNPEEINGILIAQAGSKARYLGRIELTVKNKQLIKKEGKLIDVASIKEEVPELKDMIDRINDNPALEKVIATLAAPVEELTAVGNMTCDAIKKYFNLDIVFNNSGGIRVNRLGPVVKLKDIYALHPFENRIVQYKMTPEEMRSLIKFDYKRFKKPDLLVSGIRCIVTLSSHGKIIKIDLEDENNQLLDETKTYNVGINDYMASTYEFVHQDPGKSLMGTLNDALIHYLQQEKNPGKGVNEPRLIEKITTNDTANENTKNQ